MFEPGDALGELAREPPALPDEAARAAAAALLGLVPGDHERPGVVPEDGGDCGRTVPCPIDAVDGSAAIRDVAARFGTDENIAAGAAKLAAERPRGEGGAAPYVLEAWRGGGAAVPSRGAADDALEGWGPLAYPILPLCVYLGFPVALVAVSSHNSGGIGG